MARAVLLAVTLALLAQAAFAEEAKTPALPELEPDDFDKLTRMLVTRQGSGVLAALFYNGTDRGESKKAWDQMAAIVAAIERDGVKGVHLGGLDVAADRAKKELYLYYGSVGDLPPEELPCVHIFRYRYPMGIQYKPEGGQISAQALYDTLFEYRTSGDEGGGVVAKAYEALRWTLAYLDFELRQSDSPEVRVVIFVIVAAYVVGTLCCLGMLFCTRKAKKKRA